MLAAGYFALEAIRRRPRGPALLANRAWPWLGRAALTVAFVLALLEFVRETSELV